MRSLVAAVSASKLNETLSQVLESVSCERVRAGLVPVINLPDVSGNLADLMQVLQPSTTVALVSSCDPAKLAILLRAPSRVLTSLVSNANSEQLLRVLVPLMDFEDVLLEETVLPFLAHLQQPENLAAVVNQSEPELLFWFLRDSQPLPLAGFLNACTSADFGPEGAVTALMRELADHRGLVRTKVIPLIDRADPQKMAQMVQGVRAQQLMEVLQRLPLEGLVRLLTHTNAELVVRLFNGPLESTVASVAGITAQALNNPLAAQHFTRVTDNVTIGLQQAESIVDDVKAHADMVAAHVAPVVDNVKAQADKVLDDVKAVKAQADKVLDDVKAQTDKVKDKVMDDVSNNRRRGKMERGGSDADTYQFGDVARGFVANQVDEVKNIAKLGAQTRGVESQDYKFGDITRGMAEIAKAGVKEALEKHRDRLESGQALLKGLSFAGQDDQNTASTEALEDNSSDGGPRWWPTVALDGGDLPQAQRTPSSDEPATSSDRPASSSDSPGKVFQQARPATDMPTIPFLNIAAMQGHETGSMSGLTVLPVPDTAPDEVVCLEPPGKGISQVFQSVASAAQAQVEALRAQAMLHSCNVNRDPSTGLPAQVGDELDFRSSDMELAE